MFDKGVGLVWWHNMVSGKKMQSTYPIHGHWRGPMNPDESTD
jgi:hypothetical protein